MPADYDNTAETEVNDSSANRRPVLTRRRVLGTAALAVALLGGGTWAGTITGVLPQVRPGGPQFHIQRRHRADHPRCASR